jgi:hypothetical protein
MPHQLMADAGAALHRNAELLRAVAQNGFHLRIAVQTLSQCAHAVGDALRASVIAAIGEAHARAVEAAPARDEAVGPLVGVVPYLSFDLHGADGALRASLRRLARQAGVFGERAGEVARGLGPDLVEPVPGFGQGRLLVGQDRQIALLHTLDIANGARIT